MRIEGLNNSNLLNKTLNQEEKQDKGFSDILKDFVIDVNNDLTQAKIAKEKLMTGEVENINQLVYQIGKAGISFRLITEIRNKALESYQEIMRMQV